MKKILILMLLVMATVGAKAQMYVGGTIGFWYNSHDDLETTNFAISPELGYNLNEKWAVGGIMSYSYSKVEYSSAISGFALAPYARYSYYEKGMVRLFVDGGVGVSIQSQKNRDDVTGVELGFKPGIALKLNESFSLTAKVGFLGWRQDYTLGSNGQGFALSTEELSLGFHYEF